MNINFGVNSTYWFQDNFKGDLIKAASNAINCNIINTHAEKAFTTKLKCSRFNIVLQGIKQLIANSQKAKKGVPAM